MADADSGGAGALPSQAASGGGAGEREPAAPWDATRGSISAAGCTPIGQVEYRHRCRVHGRVRSVRVRPWADVPTLELTVIDDTGGITVVFLGRRSLNGVGPGSVITVEGVVGTHFDRLAILNPAYDLRP